MSATDTEPTSAIAIRETGAAIIKPVPIPRELQEVGVKIGQDESGLRVIVLPPAVRDAVNLLTPVSSWNQADPNWTPSISLVTLSAEKDVHTYTLPGGKLGLNKQALETLGKAAGVLYTRTARVPAGELHEGETWAYRATLGFRRSDGTVDEVTRERGFSREAEMMEIEDAVRKARGDSGPRYATEAAVEAECRKRWIAELRFGPAKTESKAINRALRAALAMPSSVKPATLQKPFLVIGFNFTPDYNDPDIKRALVAAGLNAQAAIYGGREISNALPELAAGDVPGSATPAPPEDVAGLEDVPPPGDGEQASAGERAPAEAPRHSEPAFEPAFDDETPEPVDEPPPADEPPVQGLQIPAKAIDEAGATIVRGEGATGKSVKTIVEMAKGGHATAEEWLIWAARELEDEDPRWQALKVYVEHREPDVWTILRNASGA